jgi:hypothetical protein
MPKAHAQSRLCDWEWTEGINSSSPSPGRNVLDVRSREKHDFKKPDFQLRGVTTMTKTKIALAAALFAVTTSAAFAGDFDPDLANRYQSYAEPNAYGYSASGNLGDLHSEPSTTLQSSQVRLQKYGNTHLSSHAVLQQRDVALPSEPTQGNSVGPFWYSWSGPTAGGM